jgi:HSP20 family protein
MLSEYAVEGRWPDLFRDMRRTQDQMNRLFGGLRFAQAREFPAVNVWVGATGALVTAEIPGVVPDQMDVTVHQNTITLQGKRDPEVVDSEAVMHRQERAHGPFNRTIVLPFRVDADKVSARFERGVLTLELPRPSADQPRQIKITSA